MSRRSHYRAQRGPRPGRADAAPSAPATPAPGRPALSGHDPGGPRPPREVELALPRVATETRSAPEPRAADPSPVPISPKATPAAAVRAAVEPPANGDAKPGLENGYVTAPANGCTAPQLRRFIKSRAWVPMHELRRRFGINGTEDDVTPVAVDGSTIFVGLPGREGQLLGELLRAGDIGYELSMDPCTPIVIGVYPMRPVPRH
jgi:hypothetical protein